MLILAIALSCVSVAEPDLLEFSIREGKAIKTLKQAARQAGEVEILYSARVVKGQRTQPIVGFFSLPEALDRMLKGTPLEAVPVSGGEAFAIMPRAKKGGNVPERSINFIQKTPIKELENQSEMNLHKKNKKFKINGLFKGLFGLAFASSLATASAQDDSEDDSEDEKVYELSPFEVNESNSLTYLAQESVSGTRISIPLTRIPQKITTLTKDLLDDVNAFGSDEAIYYGGAERFRFQQSGVSIRGFRSSFQVDNLDWGTDIKMDNIITERIDIAKGPAGTIYGVGTPGGAINLTTKKPMAESSGHIRLMYGSRDSYRIEGDVTGSFDEEKKWRYRLSGARNRVETDLLFGEMTLDTLMPQISWHPSDKTTVEFQVIHQDTPDWNSFDERFPQVGGQAQPPNPDFPIRGAAIGLAPGIPENFNVPGPQSDRSDQTWWATTTWKQQFSESVSMKLAHRKTWFDEERWTRFMMGGPQYDATGNITNPDIQVGNWFQDKYRETETIQADFNIEWRAQNGMHGSIVTGGNYFIFDQDNMIFWDFGCCGQSTPKRGNTLNVVNPPTDPSDSDWGFSTFKQDYELNNWEDKIVHAERGALWALSNTYFANDRGNIVLGMRRSYSFAGENSVLNGTRYDNRGNQTDTFGGETQSLDTYMAGGTYEFVRNGNDYITGFFGYTETKDFNRFPYAPKAGSGVEGGLRFATMDRKFVASVSYYDIIQENILRNDPNLGNQLVLSGKEASQGIEFEAFFYPFDGATLFFQYVDQDTAIVSHVASPFLEGNPAGDGGYETAFSGAFTYRVPKGEHQGAGFTLGFINRGETAPFPDDGWLWALRQPGYTVLNLNMWYPIPDTNATVEFAIKNLTDEFYFRGAMIPGRRQQIYAGMRWGF
ncbi:MAG: TonB-dependent receptor [Opitutaceae bacterium]|nr:TonB-dependent receptor [Opitutaceae bacterium]